METDTSTFLSLLTKIMEIDISGILALITVGTTVVASLCYCYFIAVKIPHGITRLLSFSPILTLFSILPLCCSSTILIGFVSFLITWLANFKLLLFSFNLGPLSRLQHQQRKHPFSLLGFILTSFLPTKAMSLLNFILVGSLPIKVRDCRLENTNQAPKPRSIFSNLWTKMVASYVLLCICDQFRDLVPPRVLLAWYCWLLYLAIDHALGLCNLVVGPILGFELEPPSDDPYLSTSLQDFWGKRWNRVVADALRQTVYQPGRSALRDKSWGVFAAVFAAFVVSGLMHELILFYLTRVCPSWEMTWFFVLHGACVVLEMMLKRGLGRRVRIRWAVSGPLTIGFLMVTGIWLFFPQFVRNRVDAKVTEEFKSVIWHVKEMYFEIRGIVFQS